MSIVIGLIICSSTIYILYVYPAIWNLLPIQFARLHTIFAVYLIFSVTSNYVLCLFTRPGRPPRQIDGDLEKANNLVQYNQHLPDIRTRSETWRYCQICRGLKPPRCHHCSSCGECYYKLCHHCPALGKCVGRDNYPFFFRFLISAWFGSLFLGITCSHIQKQSVEMINLLFATTVASSAVGVAVGVLGTWHIYLLLSGQTTIEWLENMQMKRMRIPRAKEWGWGGGPFNKGIYGNVREGFGDGYWRWSSCLLNLFIPVQRVVKSIDPDAM